MQSNNTLEFQIEWFDSKQNCDQYQTFLLALDIIILKVDLIPFTSFHALSQQYLPTYKNSKDFFSFTEKKVFSSWFIRFFFHISVGNCSVDWKHSWKYIFISKNNKKHLSIFIKNKIFIYITGNIKIYRLIQFSSNILSLYLHNGGVLVVLESENKNILVEILGETELLSPCFVNILWNWVICQM